MVGRTCRATKSDGTSCQAAPLTDSDYCRMHSPDHVAEVQEARRLGGLRRRREVTVQGAYAVGDFRCVAGLTRVLEVAILDVLGLDNTAWPARAPLVIWSTSGSRRSNSVTWKNGYTISKCGRAHEPAYPRSQPRAENGRPSLPGLWLEHGGWPGHVQYPDA